MSTQKSQGLLSQSYPSAFEQKTEEASVVDAFGAPASLPGSSYDSSPRVASHENVSDSRLHDQPDPFGLTSGAEQGVPQQPGYLPAITADQIVDPVLRAKLSLPSHSVELEESVSPADPFGTATLNVVDSLNSGLSTTSLQPTVYPSASAQTTSIPLREYKRKPAASRSRLGQSLKSFVSNQHTVTQPLRGIANFAQQRFALAAQKRHEQYIQEKEQAREVLNFTVRLAETMFHFGADARDVDSAMVAICAAYGLEDVEVNVTNQSVIVNYVSDSDYSAENLQSSSSERSQERFSHTVVRVVRTRSDNFSSLTSIYRLINRITEQGLSRAKAERQLKEINQSKKLYSPLSIRIAELCMIGFFTIGVGGSWRAALVAVLIASVALYTMGLASKMNLPKFFLMAIGSGIITAGALWVGGTGSFAEQMGIYVSSPHVVAAGLFVLLPTSMMVSSAQDALTGYPLTAAGKFVTTALEFLGLVVGIALALTVMSYFDAATLDVQQTVFNPPPLWLSIIGMILGSIAAVAATQGTVSNMLWIFLVAGAGQIVYYGFTALTGGEPTKFGVALAAFTVGTISTFIAYKLHSPQITLYLPGFLFLLPGLSIFRGLYSMVIDPSPIAGISNLVGAFSTIIAMASGVVLGSYVIHFVIQKSLEKRSPVVR